nr:uncharacterized mitochondrial protein AtMg00810-like [Tanacetum cinerariifolium]
MLVQVYVDDIIFESTKKSLCTEFEGLIHKKFQMSYMEELTFFIGLQVMQRDDGIFISQEKYVADILKKFDFSLVMTASTPIETNKALLKDEEAEDVDVHVYRSIIGSLMYLTAFRPDIMFVVCACTRFQVTPIVSHLHAMKRIFRYLKGQPKLGLWYPRDSPFDLEAFSDSDYARASLDRISTPGELRESKTNREKSEPKELRELATVKVKNVNGEAQIQALVDRKKVIIIEASIRKDLSTMASAIIYLATNLKFNFSKYIFDNMEKHLDGGVKFVMFLRFVQLFFDNQVEGMDRHNAPEEVREGSEIPTDPHHTPIVNQPSSSQPKKKQKSRRKQRKEIEVTSPSSEVPNDEGVPRTSNDPLPSGRMIDNLDQDVEITLVDQTHGRMNEEEMFGVNDLDGDEVVMDVSASKKVKQSVKVIEKEVSTVEVTAAATTLQISKDELTLAQTLIEIKAAKPKVNTTAATTVTTVGTRPKEKGIGKMVEPKRPLKRKDQIMMDAKVAKNLKARIQAELEEEEERLARLKEEETNIALIKSWDNTQAMMDADYELAQRLQTEEPGELTIEEKSRLFVELINKRKKYFAKLRSKQKRRKPPTKPQKRNQICTCLKNMENYKHNQLKSKSFKEIQMLFNNTMKWIEAFVPMDTGLVKGSEKAVKGSKKAKEGSSKRARSNLEQGDTKRQRLEEDNESAKLKRCLEIVPDYDDDDDSMVYYLLVDKMYPFTRNILHQMWNDVRLQVDYEVEMAYDLLRLIKRQINEG